MSWPRDARELRNGLADRMDDVVRELLPNVTFSQNYWHCGDLQGNAGDSLWGKRAGRKGAGRFEDAATGEKGDALEFVQKVRGLNLIQAKDWARDFLGVTNTKNYDPKEAQRRKAKQEQEAKAESISNTACARNAWSKAQLSLGSPVQTTYLPARRIKFTTASLRYGAALLDPGTRQFFPAMLGAAQGPDGKITGIVRTFLTADCTRKAQISSPRKMLGRVIGSAVRFAKAGEHLAVAEGIESAMSFQQIYGLPTWAALSTSGLRALVLPDLPLARSVVIAADNDDAGLKAALNAAERFQDEGRRVRISHPEEPGDDWNDVLVRGGQHD